MNTRAGYCTASRCRLIDLRITGAQDGIRRGATLVSRFGHLADGMSNAGFRPTDQHVEVQTPLAERVRARGADFDPIAAADLAAINQSPRACDSPSANGSVAASGVLDGIMEDLRRRHRSAALPAPRPIRTNNPVLAESCPAPRERPRTWTVRDDGA